MAEDAEKLLSDCGLRCAPTLEIGKVATRLQAADGLVFPALSPDEMVRPGLAGLSLACGHVLSKPKSVSRSDWERRPLTPQQQRYAVRGGQALQPAPRLPLPIHAPFGPRREALASSRSHLLR